MLIISIYGERHDSGGVAKIKKMREAIASLMLDSNGSRQAVSSKAAGAI